MSDRIPCANKKCKRTATKDSKTCCVPCSNQMERRRDQPVIHQWLCNKTHGVNQW